MLQEKLFVFVKEQVQKGEKKSEIKEKAISVGWREEDVDAAYAKALEESGVPVPDISGAGGKYAQKMNTVEIVLNVFSYILLGVIATALGGLYFGVINHFFPDKAVLYGSYYQSSNESIHYQIAALLIGSPIYYLVMRYWFRRFREQEKKIESKLTRVITYLVLLVASVTIVGDLIVIVFTFLQGEMSARFILKAVTLLAIASAIFGFYYLERKQVQYRKNIGTSVFRLFAIGLFVAVFMGIVLGFAATGSPSSERQRNLDNQRSQHLSNLAGCIGSYAQTYGRLPESLDDLQKSSSFSYCFGLVDPENNSPYEYRVISQIASQGALKEGEFELCATFSLQSLTKENAQVRVYPESIGKWHDHGVGRSCDSETVATQ